MTALTEEQKEMLLEATGDAQKAIIFQESAFLHTLRYIGKHDQVLDMNPTLYTCLLEGIKKDIINQLDIIIKEVEEKGSTKTLL